MEPVQHSYLPIEAALDVLGGKWKIIILCHLKDSRKRTFELKQLIPQISQKMLTQQLRELEADGIVIREIRSEIPPKVDYYLSEYGQSLKSILDTMDHWGEKHIEHCEQNI